MTDFDSLPHQEKTAVLTRTRENAFRHFINRLRAAGQWKGMERETEALIIVLEQERARQGTSDQAREEQSGLLQRAVDAVRALRLYCIRLRGDGMRECGACSGRWPNGDVDEIHHATCPARPFVPAEYER